MSESNPFRPPSAAVADPAPATPPGRLHPPRVCPAGHGSRWIAEGFELFRRDPWMWILNVIIFFTIMMILGMAPFLSLVSSLLGPVFVAGLILGCRDQDQGRPLEVAHVFAGFQNQTGRLVALGALNLLVSLLLFGLAMGVVMMFGGMDMLGTLDGLETGHVTPEQAAGMMLPMLLAVLVVMLFAIPVAMLFWFAPTLIVLHSEVGVIEALQLSFMGCLRNMLPFLIYGLVLLVLAIVATIPFMLGWLVLGPVFFGSVYASYKDIYLAGEDG